MPGAGKYRGGIGVVKSQRILTDGIITHESERHTNVPWGIFGGKEGAPGKCEIYNVLSNGPAQEMHSKFHGLEVKQDDVMAYYSPCGGGFGSPLERDPQKVLDDVLDGFCSATQAHDVYGVVLDLTAETVDLGATATRREQLETAS
jgi:N-methylhydantoinase B